MLMALFKRITYILCATALFISACKSSVNKTQPPVVRTDTTRAIQPDYELSELTLQQYYEQGYEILVVGSEPPFNLRMDVGGVFAFKRAAEDEFRFAVRGEPVIDSNGTSVYQVGSAGHQGTIQIISGKCNDRISKSIYPMQGVVRLDGVTYMGCAMHLYDRHINGRWRLVKINGSDFKGIEEAKIPVLNFKGDELRVYGFLGCNKFDGQLMLQGNNIKFLGIGTTKVACNNPLQNSLLVILEKAVKYQIKPGSLLIQTDKGESAEFAFQGND